MPDSKKVPGRICVGATAISMAILSVFTASSVLARESCASKYDEYVREKVVIPALQRENISEYEKLNINNPSVSRENGHWILMFITIDPNIIDGPKYRITMDACMRRVISLETLDTTIISWR